jgi:hypothetical protein
MASPLFSQFPLFERDYLQTGYSYMLDISYLLNNNTVKGEIIVEGTSLYRVIVETTGRSGYLR